MHTYLTSGDRALEVRARVDRLLMGPGLAARYRVMKLLDPAAATALRRSALPSPKAHFGAPAAPVSAVRDRVASLLSSAPVAQPIAA